MAAVTERDRLRKFAFYAFLLVGAYLVYEVVRPFLSPLAWAGVLAICFYPVQQRFEQRLRPSSAALLTTTCVALVIIVPTLAIASAFVAEASPTLRDLPGKLATLPASVQEWTQRVGHSIPGGKAFDPATLLADAASRATTFVSSRAAAMIQDSVALVATLAIALFALFFLLRDGPGLMAALRRAVPLDTDLRERLFRQTATMVTASVRSNLIVAAVQGLLCGLAFWIVGLSAPVFWAVVTMVCCLLPLGGWVVWAPAALWLVMSGSVSRGVLLGALGGGIVSGVDNVLRPMLLSGASEMNGLMLLISLIGGIAAFGSVGLVAGPALMAAAVALFDVFTSAPGTDATEGGQNSETAGASKEGAAGSRDDMKAHDARESGARQLSHATARR
jgi:predicted PurR-regulated permease PerM